MALSAYHNSQSTEHAADKAAESTQAAADTSAQVQREALAQQKELSQPYRDFGESSLGQLKGLLGLGGADPTATLRATPGYQFQQQQGTQNTLNAASAMGMTLSGNTLQGLSTFNQGLADTTYQQAVGNAEFGAQLGQASAAGQAANVGANANSLGNIYTNQGNNIANIGMNEAASLNAINNKYQQDTQNTVMTLAMMT
jgi:hypothetical protein